MPRPRLALALVVAAFVSVPSSADADTCTAGFYSTCINDDNLWPHAGSSHFLTIGGTETAARGEVGFGLYTTYLSRPIVLQTNSGGNVTSDNAIDNQLNGNFLFSYGVTNRLELDAVIPTTFSQSGTGAASLTGATSGLSNTGVRDLRFGFSYALVPRRRVDPTAYVVADVPRPSVWALTGRFEMSAPTGDTSSFGSDGHAVWAPSIAADYRRGRWFGGAEVGARLRPTEEIAGARIGSQAFVGLGLGFDVLARELLAVTAEAYALPTFAEQHNIEAPTGQVGVTSVPNGQYVAPAEWALSVRTAPLFGGDLQIQGGGGGSIPFTSEAPITNPRFRFSLSVRYAPLGRDSDGDGVLDRDDKCPFVHGIAGNPAGEGCPAIVQHEVVDLTGTPVSQPPPPPTTAAPDAGWPPSPPPPPPTR